MGFMPTSENAVLTCSSQGGGGNGPCLDRLVDMPGGAFATNVIGNLGSHPASLKTSNTIFANRSASASLTIYEISIGHFAANRKSFTSCARSLGLNALSFTLSRICCFSAAARSDLAVLSSLLRFLSMTWIMTSEAATKTVMAVNIILSRHQNSTVAASSVTRDVKGSIAMLSPVEKIQRWQSIGLRTKAVTYFTVYERSD